MLREKQEIKQDVIERMETLGVYKSEYDDAINIYVDMLHQYESLSEKFENSGYEVEEPHTNKAGATNMRKTQVLSALEKLRIDIATYSNMLCINPKQYNSVKVEDAKQSGLSEMLAKMGG